MKAMVYRRYGPPEVLEAAEVPKPVPGDRDVLVRVHATSVTSGDARLRAFRVPPLFWLPSRLLLGVRRPKSMILGSEFAGVVEAVGGDVDSLKPGEAVYGMRVFGGYAEYLCLPEAAAVALKPYGLGFEEAAAIPFGALSALDFLRKAGIAAGQSVLINGASGAVGVAAVQLAKHFRATVTGVCSAAGLELVRSLGADHVIDYTDEDFTRNGERYDIILDCAGTAPFTRCWRSLAPWGTQVALNTRLADLLLAPWARLAGGRRIISGIAAEKKEDLLFLSELIDSGALKPVIDRRYPLGDLAAAHRYVDAGHKKGSVVVTLEHLIAA